MANKGKSFSDNDLAYPRITFQAPGRTFDRLLKESSLSDLQETVRKKLGLGLGSVVQFAQLRNGQFIDLEDEDDFDAFCAVANEQRHANVQVVLKENIIADDFDTKASTSSLPPTPASALPSFGHLNAKSSTSDPGAAVPPKKVVLRDENGIEVNLETLVIKKTKEHAKEDELIQEREGELQPSKEDATREDLHIDTALSKKRRPGPLDLSKTRPPPSRLALVRPLEDFSVVTYPEGIRCPKPELNIGAKGGKFRYDPDFLMQFMSLCKDKPVFLFPLDAFGLEPLHPPSVTGRDNRSALTSGSSMPFHNSLLQRTKDQGVDPTPSHRTRTKRGEKKSEASKAAAAAVGSQAPDLDPVAPVPESSKTFSNNDPDSPEVVDTSVKALLDKLPMEDFDSISDQIVQWANRSEQRKDGRILIQVTRLVFEKAMDDAPWSGIYARLCKKMVEHISPKVQDEGTRNFEGKPITGGQLFCKYLLNRCHEDFERGWSAKEVTAPNKSGEIVVDSDEYYAAQKAKRQGLGLIKFIGELFKRQILTERIMHACIQKLLDNAENLLEEHIESLCTLLTTVGSLLDTRIARVHMDIYFQRMQGIGKNVSPRIQSMLQDLIELRKRNWQARKAVIAPTIITQVHEAVVEEKADQETEAIQRLSISCGGSRRGGTRDEYPQADGWNSVSRATARAGDLSQFGRFGKAQPPTMLGPSSVFVGKKDIKREVTSRTGSSSNMFSALQEESNKAAEQPLQRKKLVLQPRSKPVEDATPAPEGSITPSSEEASTVFALTEEAADAKISEDIKEFFSIRNLDEAEVYFTALPSLHHHRLVHKLVSSAVESKERDAVLVADLFRRANSKGLCSSDAFEEGLAPTAEIIEDIAIDAPKAWSLFATMVKGAQSNEGHRTRLTSKIADSDKLLGLLSDVIGLRESKWKARKAIIAPATIVRVPETL